MLLEGILSCPLQVTSLLRHVFAASGDLFGTVGVSCLSTRNDGRVFASAHWDHTVRLYQTKNLKPLAVLRHHRGSVHSVRFSRPYHSGGGDSASAEQIALMATGSKDSSIAVWHLLVNSVRMPT
jgi:WD40 repeat protein